MDDYNMAISPKADDAGFYDKSGSLRFDEGDHEGGLQDLNQAVQLVPGNPDYYDDRAYMKAFMGAIEDSQKAAELYKKNNQEEDYKRVLENLRKLQA
jgi:Flp pilus assembly protein TadD